MVDASFLSLVISGALTPLLLELVFASLLRGRNLRARRDYAAREFILEYGRSARRLPILFTAFWCLFLAAIVAWQGPPEGTDLAWFFVTLLVIAGPLLAFTIEAWGVSHRITLQGIRRKSPWSREVLILWSDVAAVSFNANLNHFTVRSPHGTARFSLYLDGLRSFAKGVKDNVPRERWSSAAGMIDALARPGTTGPRETRAQA